MYRMSQLASEQKVWIPEITDNTLAKLAERIKPVVDFGGRIRNLQYIKPCDLRKIAYPWDPTPAKEAKDLEKIVDIKTYHSYGAPVFFKPSIAEVIAQIPKEHLDEVTAFEILESIDPCSDNDALNAGYHIAVTRLYKTT